MFFADFCDVFVVPAAWGASRTGLILDAQIPLFKARKPNTRERLRACSLKASWSISNDSVGVFPRRKQNFKQFLCSFKSDITISTGSRKLPSRKLTVRPIELLQENVRLATDSWGSREEALTLSFSHSSAFGGLETSLFFYWVPPHILAFLTPVYRVVLTQKSPNTGISNENSFFFWYRHFRDNLSVGSSGFKNQIYLFIFSVSIFVYLGLHI